MQTYPQVILFGSIYPDWREKYIIPVLEELGVTYYNPLSPTGWWFKELGDKEAIIMANCETIVMVFTSAFPSFTGLAEAGWAALGAQVRGQTFIMQIDHDVSYQLPESMRDAPEYADINRQLAHWTTSSRYLVQRHAEQFNIATMHIVDTIEDVVDLLRRKYRKA